MNNKLSVKTVYGDGDGLSDERKKEKSKNHEYLDDLTLRMKLMKIG